MLASINQIEKKKKEKPVDRPGEPIHRPAEPIHAPAAPPREGRRRGWRRCSGKGEGEGDGEGGGVLGEGRGDRRLADVANSRGEGGEEPRDYRERRESEYRT